MQNRRIWIGPWTIFVATGHTVVGLLFGGEVALDAVGSDPMTGLVVWFLLFGAALALLGMAITALERSEQFASARPLAIGIALLTIGLLRRGSGRSLPRLQPQD